MNLFWKSPRPEKQWFFAGLTSSFPEVDSEFGNLARPRACNEGIKPGCKVFDVSKEDSSKSTEIEVDPDSLESTKVDGDWKDQVLVFQYKGKFHAIDHQCPHSSFPLSQGIPFDIEDFGVVLSAGLTCPKHSWSFDLFSGMSDRGSYKLKRWEVELRHVKDGETTVEGEKEVWVRRKQRMG